MVKNTRKATCLGPIKPLNPPIPITVKETEYHKPVNIILDGMSLEIISIEDIWEIYEEWWRVNPIVRTYYKVTTRNHMDITIFRDQLDGNWYKQHAFNPIIL